MPSNHELLRPRDFLLLLIVSMVVSLSILLLEPVPGYMDAAYYYATGIEIAKGNGFTEPFAWNYLDGAQSLPHPSHSYWYPLASILSAGGMFITGKMDFLSGRLPFLLIAIIFPLVVAYLSWKITGKRWIALTSGFLAIFSGYYLPFIVSTDNYAIYILLGTIYLLLLSNATLPHIFFLGFLAGLMNLARADGLIWLPLTFFAVFITLKTQSKSNDISKARKSTQDYLLAGLLILGGYLCSYGFWLARNLVVYKSLVSPGGGHILWMTDYNQIFSFNPGEYTFQTLLSSGWKSILQVRLKALWINLGTAFFAQGMILLTPFIVYGAWKNRKSPLVLTACVGWAVLILAESILFPFASVRGGFFHAAAGFQPAWFLLAPMGIDGLMGFSQKTKWNVQFQRFFHILVVIFALLMSMALVKIRVLDSGWNEGEYLYLQVETILTEQGVSHDEVIMVVNPPAYYAMTGRKAIVLPSDGLPSIKAAGKKFQCEYIVLEKNRLIPPLVDLYNHPENYQEFTVIAEVPDVLIVHIENSE